MNMTLERLEEIEKNYKKVYQEELNRVFELYPNARAIYEGTAEIPTNTKEKKRFFFFRKRKDSVIKLNK
ncbi:MAG: hypothetical protein MJ245_00140 [Clostridia bacterium]|nr:hypothetical protein [Clostridia bacterium]